MSRYHSAPLNSHKIIHHHSYPLRGKVRYCRCVCRPYILFLREVPHTCCCGCDPAHLRVCDCHAAHGPPQRHPGGRRHVTRNACHKDQLNLQSIPQCTRLTGLEEGPDIHKHHRAYMIPSSTRGKCLHPQVKETKSLQPCTLHDTGRLCSKPKRKNNRHQEGGTIHPDPTPGLMGGRTCPCTSPPAARGCNTRQRNESNVTPPARGEGFGCGPSAPLPFRPSLLSPQRQGFAA